jgi:hypothetical protein
MVAAYVVFRKGVLPRRESMPNIIMSIIKMTRFLSSSNRTNPHSSIRVEIFCSSSLAEGHLFIYNKLCKSLDCDVPKDWRRICTEI